MKKCRMSAEVIRVALITQGAQYARRHRSEGQDRGGGKAEFPSGDAPVRPVEALCARPSAHHS